MKIAVTSTGRTLEDQVEARFGRCSYFLVVDTDSMQFEAIENPNIALGGGAGIQSAQMMAEKGVTHVLTGNCGPNAFQVFAHAGVKVVVGLTGSVRDAVERFKASELTPVDAPNVESHFGMEPSEQPVGQASNAGFEGALAHTFGMGMGRGGGMGGGRGMRMGRGMGRGRGMGLGTGPGVGFGMWGFGGMHVPGVDFHRPTSTSVDKPPVRPPQQGGQVGTGVGAPQSGRKAVAFVRTERCAGCGICVGVCPANAIEIHDGKAHVDAEVCVECGLCVGECPQHAIRLE